jgi:hypothetical protein
MTTDREQPIQDQFRAGMNAIASAISKIFPKAGFALLIFKTGDDDDRRANYISNVNRADMLVAMKEFIARNEGRLHETDTKQ